MPARGSELAAWRKGKAPAGSPWAGTEEAVPIRARACQCSPPLGEGDPAARDIKVGRHEELLVCV